MSTTFHREFIAAVREINIVLAERDLPPLLEVHVTAEVAAQLRAGLAENMMILDASHDISRQNKTITIDGHTDIVGYHVGDK